MYSPKRQVRSNGRTVVGLVSSHKNTGVQFESALEEGFLYILTFDREVKNYHSQPVQIPYVTVDGKESLYTPDYLVEYLDRSPVLFEVKSAEWLKENKVQYQSAIDAGKRFAASNGWEYRIVTDKVIRTDYVDNVRFLFRFQDYLIEKILGHSAKSIEALVQLMPDNPSALLSSIWAMIYKKKLSCNLFRKLTMESRVRLSDRPFEMKYPYQL